MDKTIQFRTLIRRKIDPILFTHVTSILEIGKVIKIYLTDY